MLSILSDHNVYLKSLNTQSRDINTHGNQLAKVHIDIGRVLAQHYIIKEIAVTNPQGKRGMDKAIDCDKVTIICLMRAGLYVALGVRELLGGKHIFWLSNDPDDIPEKYITDRDVVIVDSVINSGKTLMNYLDNMKKSNSVTAMTIVMQDRFQTIIDEQYSDVDFIVSRVSKNAYVGKGTTDTGNRLFGTF